jgi:hypothetical protein
MVLEGICPPALLYLAFSIIQIIIDLYRGDSLQALFKFIVMIVFTIVLNAICAAGMSIISWFIVFIPFILMTYITTILFFVFGFNPSKVMNREKKCGETQFGCCNDGVTAKRDPSRGQMDISAGGMLAIDESLTGEDQQKVLDFARPSTALYVGGMGARGKNFYNDICKSYGYEKEAVEIQDLYLDGKKQEAAAKVPSDWLLNSHLVGPKSFIKERLSAFKEAGVTVISVNPIGPDAVQQVELLRTLMDEI